MLTITGKPINRILVVRQGGLGDFILTLPLIDALKIGWPGAAIDILGNRHHAQLALETGRAAACYDPDEVAFSSLFSTATKARQDHRAAPFLERYDLVVSFQRDREGSFQRNMEALGVPVIFISPAVDSKIHATAQFLAPLRELGIGVGPSKTHISVPHHFQELATRTIASLGSGPGIPIVVIHPGSGSSRKNWPAPNIASVLRSLKADGRVNAIITCGEADEFAFDALEKCFTAFPFPSLRSFPLMHLAAVIQKAAAFLGNDTGVSHLAAAVGTPTLTLFGPTSPAVWRPLGRHVEVFSFAEATPSLIASRLLELALPAASTTPSQP